MEQAVEHDTHYILQISRYMAGGAEIDTLCQAGGLVGDDYLSSFSSYGLLKQGNI